MRAKAVTKTEGSSSKSTIASILAEKIGQEIEKSFTLAKLLVAVTF